MKLAALFKEVAGNCPNFVIKATAARLSGDAQNDRGGDELGGIFLKHNFIFLYKATVVADHENVFDEVVIIVDDL